MKTKTCINCGKVKPLTEFYIHPMMADGHVNGCKECQKKRVKADFHRKHKDPEWRESEKERAREKYHRLYGYRKIPADVKKANMKRYHEKYPEKYAAGISRGGLSKLEGFHNHHWSYRTEHHKDVISLTMKMHLMAHRFMIYDQERMQYRTRDWELLDTRERHVEYIQSCGVVL